MALDSDIRNIVDSAIENDLAAPKVPKKRVPSLKKAWRCDNAHDFLYGHRVGYYKGLAEGLVLERHRRQLTEGEENDVFKIVERHSKDLRRYFLYYREKQSKVRPAVTNNSTSQKING